jgi:drug/metabolite transporter (DMT)-like permease
VSDGRPSGREWVWPHLALFAVQVIFGTWPVFGKMAMRAVPATSLVAFRVGGAAVAFLLLNRLTGRRDAPAPARADYARFFLYAMLGVVLNQLLFTKGLSLSTVVNSTLIGTAIPVFALLVSVVLGYEGLTLRKLLGTAVAASGVVYLVDPFGADFSGGRALGNVLLVSNTFVYAAYIAISQESFKKFGALTVLGWVFLFGSLITVPLGVYQMSEVPLAGLGAEIWLTIIYIILVPTVGAYYLNAWALARVSPSTVAAYIYLQPLIASAIAPLVLGAEEGFHPRALLAAGLIFAGVALVTLRAGSRAAAELSEHPDAIGH